MSGVEVASIGALVAVGTAVDVIRRTGGLGDLLSSTGSVAFGVGLGLAVGAAVASSLQQTPGKLEISADASTAEKLAIPSPSPASAPASISITVGDDDASAGHDEHTELQSQALPSRAASRRRSSLESLANQPCVASTELERCISMVDVALSQARPGSKVIPTLESVLKLLRRRGGEGLMAPHVRHDIASDPMFAGVDQPQMDYYMNEYGLNKTPPSHRHSVDDVATPNRPGSLAVPRYSSDVGGLRPIADGSSISLMDSVDPRTGAKMMKSLTPVWQRKMNLVPVDSLELASWEFNPFNACKVDAKQFGKDLWADHTTSGVPFALRMLQDQGCVDELCLDLRRLKRYLRKIEVNYLDNPFHNRVHALDVMQTTHFVMVHSPALLESLDAVERFALLLGAFIHDTAHPGINNKLLIKLANDKSLSIRRDLAEFAVTFSNKSVLEQHHLSTAFKLAFESADPDANPFVDLNPDDFARCRALIIELVLATDMEQHFNMLTKLRVSTANSRLLDLTNSDEKLMLLRALLHACDISNVAKPLSFSIDWTRVVNEEFWAQGEFEESLGFVPEPICQRPDLASGEGRWAQANGTLAFIRFIVQPLHEVLATQLPVFEEVVLHGLRDNIEYWEEIKGSNPQPQ